MAYIDQRTGKNQRVAAMTVVAILQGAAIVALINGLAVHWRDQIPIPNPKTTDVPITMPVDPVPPPPPSPTTQPTTRPEDPIMQLPLGPFVDPRPTIPTTIDPVVPVAADPVVPPPATPVFTPRAPKPKNAPGGWATPNDYPARDLREGNQGVTQFKLSIGADGKVQSCPVTSSSGFPGLDKATCDNVSRRARFEPGIDGSGNRITGTYSNRIRWEIPQG
jgi:protein TonB